MILLLLLILTPFCYQFIFFIEMSANLINLHRKNIGITCKAAKQNNRDRGKAALEPGGPILPQLIPVSVA